MRLLNGRMPLLHARQEQGTAALQQQVAVLVACGEALRAAGVDLTGYNSVENAADLEDLRRALGYGPWNLFGGSYGTRLALTAMRYRPDTIRSAVLDSVYPLEENFHIGVFATFDRALSGLFAACAADAACATAFPRLDQSFDTMVSRLNAAPAQIPLTNPETGELITYLPLTGVDAAAIIFQLFYITPVIPILPLLIAVTAGGNYEPIAEILSLLASGVTGAVSIGMQVAVQCNEDATFASPRAFVAARDMHRRASPLAHVYTFNEALLDICAAWGLDDPDPAENRPVRSDVPSFLIAGELDPITPPTYASRVAQNLTRAFSIVVPRAGHTPSVGSPCLSAAIAAFLDNPDRRPDTSCIAQEAPLPFVVPQ
jgi:pimeloyl-ACP methyl ester carboxylesterase